MWSSRLLSTWQDKFHSLSLREQFFLILASMAVVVFLSAQFALLPMKARLKDLEITVKNKEKDLKELKSTVRQYRSLEVTEKPRMQGDETDFNLFSALEKAATESDLMDKLDYMKPGNMQLDGTTEERWVEVKLSRITLMELSDYLYKLQAIGKGLYIKRLSVRKEGNSLGLIFQPAVIVKSK